MKSQLVAVRKRMVRTLVYCYVGGWAYIGGEWGMLSTPENGKTVRV